MQSFSWSVRFSRTSKNFPDSGIPYIGQGVVADIHSRGTDLEVYLSLFAAFVYISTHLDLERSDINRRMLFLQQIANF